VVYGARMLMWAAIGRARHMLRRSPTPRILIDTSVFTNSVTHETRWISNGRLSRIPGLESGYSARVPIHARDDTSELYREICFLAPLGRLFNEKLLAPFTSGELDTELWRFPPSLHRGGGRDDLSVFRVRPERIDNVRLDALVHPRDVAMQMQQARINACTEEPFVSLVKVLGADNSFDAFHIHTAEKHGLDAFMHLDLKLSRMLKAQERRPVIEGLRSKVLLPSQLAALYKVKPVPPYVMSYEGARFHVRPDLNAGGKRASSRQKQ